MLHKIHFTFKNLSVLRDIKRRRVSIVNLKYETKMLQNPMLQNRHDTKVLYLISKQRHTKTY